MAKYLQETNANNTKNILLMNTNNVRESVPGFQYFMVPFLQVLSDGKTRHINEVIELVINHTALTPEQCSVLLPSKSDTLVRNRIGWVRTYLYKAGLISQVSRGNYHISPAGLQALKDNPGGIDIKYLRTQPAFLEWGNSFTTEKVDTDISVSSSVETLKTPQEVLETSFQTIMDSVAEELLDRVKKITPAFFEKLVVDVLMAMGYGGFDRSNGQVTQYSGDGGIDGIIKEDKLGLDTIYIQAKRWENTVPVSAVRDFAGSLLSKKARKGVFITTSSFPQSAYDFVGSIDPKIVLIDGEQLTRMMIEYNVAVSKSKVYEIKRIDNDYFEL
jgi:restriction system protein